MYRMTVLRMMLLTLLLAASMPGGGYAANSEYQTLQKQIEQQSKRIDRLEAAIQELQSQGAATTSRQGTVATVQQSLTDPLVGTWQCSNKVFTYNMTFFADGLLLQESTTLGPMREVSWTRLSANEILLGGGIKLRTSLSGEDQMTAENLASRAQWECRKLTY